MGVSAVLEAWLLGAVVSVGVGVGGAPTEVGAVPDGPGVGDAPTEVVGVERALVVPGPPVGDLSAGLVAWRAAGLPISTTRGCAVGLAEANAAAGRRAGLGLPACFPPPGGVPSGARGPIVESPGTAEIPGVAVGWRDAFTRPVGATAALPATAALMTTAAASFPEDTGAATASPFNKPMIRLGVAHAVAHATVRR